MKRTFILAIVAVTLMGGTLVEAAGTDKASATRLDAPAYLEPFQPVSYTLNSLSQKDWFFVAVPAETTSFVEVIPPVGIDVQLELYGKTGDTPFVTLNGARIDNTSEMAYIDNFRSNVDPNDPEGIYVVVSATGSRSTIFPGEYTIKIESTPYGGSLAHLNTKRTHSVGQTFSIFASYRNLNENDRLFNVYLAMELNGIFYWGPSWTPQLITTQLPIEGDRYEDWSVSPLTFRVPASLAGTGPYNFYTAIEDLESGLFSNVASCPVYFVD